MKEDYTEANEVNEDEILKSFVSFCRDFFGFTFQPE